MTFLHILRRRVLWTLVCIAGATLAAISWTAVPALALVAGGVATLALAVSSIASRLKQDSCLGCGQSLAGLPHGDYGVICPGCGHISSGMHLNDDAARPSIAEAGLADPHDPHDAHDLPHDSPEVLS